MGRCLLVPFLIGRVTDGYQNGGSCYLSSCGGIQTDYSQFEIAFTFNRRLISLSSRWNRKSGGDNIRIH